MTKFLLILALLFPLQNTQRDRILFVGDSMTSYKGGWHHQFAKKLGREYTNVSIPGKRTDWMKLKLIQTIKLDPYFKTCVIYGGINDGFSYVKPESALKNVQDMVDICNQYGIEPVVIVGYDTKKVMVNTVYSKEKTEFHANRYAQIQKLFVTQLKDCKIIPMEVNLTRADTDDGIHFKASGHRKFAEWVYQNYVN